MTDQAFLRRNSKMNFQTTKIPDLGGAAKQTNRSITYSGDAAQVSQTALADALQIPSMGSIIAFCST
jgi:hypothetical protein